MTYEYELPELTTERTLLTVARLDQAALMQQFYLENQNFLAPWEPVRPEGYFDLPAIKMRIIESEERCILGQSVSFAAFNRDRTEMIGICNYSGVMRGVFQACYLGYAVAEKYQGQGYMTEILEATIPYMFEEWELHRIMANYMPKNSRSAAVLKKLGFEEEGLARDYLQISGSWEDHILTSKLNPKYH